MRLTSSIYVYCYCTLSKPEEGWRQIVEKEVKALNLHESKNDKRKLKDTTHIHLKTIQTTRECNIYEKKVHIREKE